jgi:hypothetical protein
MDPGPFTLSYLLTELYALFFLPNTENRLDCCLSDNSNGTLVLDALGGLLVLILTLGTIPFTSRKESVFFLPAISLTMPGCSIGYKLNYLLNVITV